MISIKKTLLFTVILFLVAFSGCGKKQVDTTINQESVRSIGNLVTIEGYYNNVAEYTKPAGVGLSHLGEKDRKIWCEYKGWARVGVNMKEVTLTQKGTNVTVTIPEAKVLDYGIDESTFTKESFVMNKDGFFNKNPISVDEQNKMINEAQETMKKQANGDEDLLKRAQDKAKNIIEGYINSLGEINGVTYNINFNYVATSDKNENE